MNNLSYRRYFSPLITVFMAITVYQTQSLTWNLWFTELKNGWIFPWQTVSHNQRVYIYIVISCYIPQKPYSLPIKNGDFPWQNHHFSSRRHRFLDRPSASSPRQHATGTMSMSKMSGKPLTVPWTKPVPLRNQMFCDFLNQNMWRFWCFLAGIPVINGYIYGYKCCCSML